MRIFLDDWYHLAIVKVILEKGYIPTWAFWEFVPSGRPHTSLLLALCEKTRFIHYSAFSVIVASLGSPLAHNRCP
ncbi:MAG: hypothetical protein OEZ25_05725 [Candidatus Bathyarchaeota archaeon]|nr:hypothetical protein [Candidatus Bathyarchaeota archaeon]